jgi:hypothetical protein
MKCKNQFSFYEYEKLVQLAVSAKKVSCYVDSPNLQNESILWRHDLEVSFVTSMALAEIDAAHGLRSYFFVNLESDFYNLLSPNGVRFMRRVIDLGHSIELHFDLSYNKTIDSAADLGKTLTTSAQRLSDILGIAPTAFSFHNPNSDSDKFKDLHYAGLVNCYADYFRSDIRYVSDSNGYWRYNSVYQELTSNDTRPLQVLTHGEWWSDKPLKPRERLADSIFEIAIDQLSNYDKSLALNQRKNLSDVSFEETDDHILRARKTWKRIFD